MRLAALSLAPALGCHVYDDPGIEAVDGAPQGGGDEQAPDGAAPDDAFDATLDLAPPSETGNPAPDADGAGEPEPCEGGDACVPCRLASDCGKDDDCRSYTCEGHMCGVVNAPPTKVLSAQTPRDCKKVYCDGMGGVAPPMVDDTDLPIDGRECTRDVCSNGTPSNPPVAPSTPCAGGTATCAGSICGGCDLPTDCPGTDTACRHRSCDAHTCGMANEKAGAAPKQAPGDCHTLHCDGAGNAANDADDADLPVDQNDCTQDLCANGVPSNPPVPVGSACSKAQGGRCASGAKCTPTFLVVRVGDGTTPLTNTSAAAFVERRFFDLQAALVKTLPLPFGANGNQKPLSLSGSTAREGVISLSADGRYASVLGYATPPGATMNVATSSSSSVNRVVGRIDANDNVDTSTALTMAFNSNNARFAVSVDGTAFWAGGAGTGAGAGLHYIAFGMTGGTQVLALPASLRAAFISGGQLYGSSADSPYAGVFTIGTGLPTTGNATATLLPGVNVPQPYQFVLLDRDPAVPGADTLYVADDRAPVAATPTSGGGIQKWTFNGTTWSNVATFNLDASGATLAVGMRGVAGAIAGTAVTLVAVSADASANRLFFYVDNGSSNPTPALESTAAANTVYRSVSLAP